ncbi:MAG TPA: hypothetical protein VLI65_03350 [Pyrinomonadaceae bacterium]|nr:hypothetical protein [Pyrinomonadaceae bacterium]
MLTESGFANVRPADNIGGNISAAQDGKPPDSLIDPRTKVAIRPSIIGCW